jgi:hypothetical protein
MTIGRRTLGIGLMVLAGALSIQNDVIAATPAKAVQGQILRIEGAFYVIQDPTGHEIRLHVDDKTDRLDHAVLQVGDPVRVYVDPDGHATSIKHLGPADRIEEDDVRKPGITPSQ